MLQVLLSVALRVAALLLLTALAVRLLRDHSAGRRHFVMVLGALGALSIPVLTLLAPRWKVGVLPQRSSVVVAQRAVRSIVPAPVRAQLSRDVRAIVAPVAPLRRARAADVRALAPLAPAERIRPGEAVMDVGVVAGFDGPVVTSPAARAGRAARTSAADARLASASSPLGWRPSPALQLVLAWLFGASLLLSQLVIGMIRRTRLANSATDLLPAAWERSRARLRARGLFPERVRLYATARSSMPMTWGVLRPVVILPEHSEWTSDERDAALLHELAHVRRGDALWLTVLSVVRALHWYNPLAWWLCAEERLAREEACDDLVLDAGVRPSAYAEQLLGIVQAPTEWRTPAAALAMARPASLTLRLQSILRAEQPRDLPGVAMRALSIAGALFLAACIGTASPVRRGASSPSRDAALSESNRRAARGSAGATTSADAASSRSAVGVGGSAAAAISTTSGDDVAGSGSASGAGFAIGSSASSGAGTAAGSGDGRAAASGSGASADAPRVTSGYAYSYDTGVATAVRSSQQDCGNTRSRKTSSSHMTNSDGRTETITWSRNGCKIEVSARGEYQLAPSLDDLRSLSRGGSFVLSEDDGRVEREVRITPASDGTLDHRYRVDGENRSWDAEGKAWFAQVVLRLDRATAWAVDVRFPALMSRGGVDAVLGEIDLLEGDYARRVYFTRLASSAQLTSAQLVRVIDTAAQKIQSDYEMAELLIAASKQKAFDDPAQLSLARAASRIRSDYEKRRAFTALLTKDGLSAATVGEILAGTKGMDSDYELAELLIEVSSRYAIAPATRRYYLDALGTIQSDYEYRRVVTALAKRPPLPPDFTRDILDHAGAHVKGYELAELLITMNKSLAKDRALSLALLDAASHLDSDYEHGRVLKDLVDQRPDAEVVVQLLKQAPKIGSAYERAEVLLAVARTYRIEGTLHDAYVDAAQSIGSDYERNRALAAAASVRRVER